MRFDIDGQWFGIVKGHDIDAGRNADELEELLARADGDALLNATGAHGGQRDSATDIAGKRAQNVELSGLAECNEVNILDIRRGHRQRTPVGRDSTLNRIAKGADLDAVRRPRLKATNSVSTIGTGHGLLSVVVVAGDGLDNDVRNG